MNKKSKEEIPVLNLFPKEYKVYSKPNYNLITILILVGMTIFILALAYFVITQTSAEEKKQIGGYLVVIGVILLVFTILWTIKKRIITFLLSLTILVAVYQGESILLRYFHMIPEPFSWGLVTFIIVSSFAYWLGTKIEWDDLLKILLFIIVAFLLNQSDWLSHANHIFSMFSLHHYLHNLYMWGWKN